MATQAQHVHSSTDLPVATVTALFTLFLYWFQASWEKGCYKQKIVWREKKRIRRKVVALEKEPLYSTGADE